MTRGLLTLDRVAVGLLGLVLLLGGVLLTVWGLDRLPGAPAELDLAPVRSAPDATWWPWAVGVAGALAVLVGVRALLAHTVRPRTRDVPLPARPVDGSTDPLPGRLHADLPPVADAAAELLSREPGVDGCRGRALAERDGAVVELHARVDASTDPVLLQRATQSVADGLTRTLPPGTARLRVRVDIRRSRYEAPRVR